jgi:hypothetical protein
MNSSIIVAFVVVVLVAVVLAYLVFRMTSNRNTTLHAPETPTGPEARFSPTRAVLVIVMTAGLAASSIIMVGPQILLIVPLALATGVVFALRRSFWSLVCFGYPFTFGLISAGMGYTELADYERTTAFAVSIGLGLIGCVLIAMGLWKALPDRNKKETSVSST